MSLDQLRLIPQNPATLQALTQQVLCWARRNGRPDTRIKTGSGWNTHVVIPPGVFEEYPAPTFTSEGQPITGPVAGQGQKTYYILETDVEPLNIADCLPVESLPTPAGLNSTAQTTTSLTMAWTASAGADGYVLSYRKEGTSAWTDQAAAASPATISGLEPDTTYRVRIKATDSSGEVRDSDWSAVVSPSTVPPPALAAPGGLTAGTTTTTTVPLTWGDVPDAEGYVVQYRQQGTPTWTQRPQVATAADTVTGLTANTTYEFQVKAVGDGVNFTDSTYAPTTPATAQTAAA